ncbi:hypothetical protein [Pseudomonas sp. N040]|uniref:hypothetical protein n=1 Tax=Pseudomonas sp. N040 TaxID=2785325 RepID=UPI0018A2BFEB|nr:hypothetical protein [Pseudomonas sp. N040]MBF7728767.1 hypothetical protein [Pseudomonas sp. N040]MBW7012407.1 hypothetical protein [Pseudomonas sp. N040]
MNSVPQAYLGVWQRTLLTTGAGLRDCTTQVYWLQTARLFADLRIPRPAPRTPDELASQGGFAGISEVSGAHCQWHRAIDFQPPSGRADIGRMHFERPDYLLEDGLDGSYHEVWERLPDSLGRNWGQWLQAADGRQGCLLLAGDYFLFAAGRTLALPHADSLQALLAQASGPAPLLDFELSFGRHRHGRQPWRIELSTLPGRAGQALLAAGIDPDQSARLRSAAVLSTLGGRPPAGGWRCRELPEFFPVQECLT